jgi:hypothetical protein
MNREMQTGHKPKVRKRRMNTGYHPDIYPQSSLGCTWPSCTCPDDKLCDHPNPARVITEETQR